MFLVLGALRRPLTVIVAVLAIVLGAGLAIRRAPVDIFPSLGVPVVYVVQPYGGMSPSQMEGQLVTYYEYHFLYIAGIEHIESQSIQGMAMLKLYFHPGTDIAADAGTPVRAAASGRVAFMGLLPSRGLSVIIDHGLGVFTGYHHLSKTDVTLGQSVMQGEAIGEIGSTGASTGPHLHWELIVGGVNVDAMLWTSTTNVP